MIDLANIQADISKKYLSLEHLRAIIYQQKLEKNKLKGKNESDFGLATCANDVLILLNNAINSGYNIECYKQNTIRKVPYKTNFKDLEKYLNFWIFKDYEIEQQSQGLFVNYSMSEEVCKEERLDYLNNEYLLIRSQIEEIINAKIPYFEDVSEVVDIKLTPLKNETKKIEELQLELEKKDKLIEKLQRQIDENNNLIMINEFMENDRLSLAIQTRKKYWSEYNPDLGNTPKAASITEELQSKYNFSKKQAEAIEIVACPINRN
ncbi:hypothetical protein ACFFHT_10605 [Gallibacterium melopsittaci]|uniref:Uncharacterized protein n=1 Tax=Gallibacterium melopsittaci TaxID=516063 RepID=A0ABV6I0T9_9PAST